MNPKPVSVCQMEYAPRQLGKTYANNTLRRWIL